jgi:hypothetical protein
MSKILNIGKLFNVEDSYPSVISKLPSTNSGVTVGTMTVSTGTSIEGISYINSLAQGSRVNYKVAGGPHDGEVTSFTITGIEWSNTNSTYNFGANPSVSFAYASTGTFTARLLPDDVSTQKVGRILSSSEGTFMAAIAGTFSTGDTCVYVDPEEPVIPSLTITNIEPYNNGDPYLDFPVYSIITEPFGPFNQGGVLYTKARMYGGVNSLLFKQASRR